MYYDILEEEGEKKIGINYFYFEVNYYVYIVWIWVVVK